MATVDSNRHVIGINDTLLGSSEKLESSIDRYRKDESLREYFNVFDYYSANKKEPSIIDLKELTNSGKYEILNSSKIPIRYDSFCRLELKYFFYGTLNFSRVYTDKAGKYGFLFCEKLSAHHCHICLLLLIKHIDTRWAIDKIKLISTS
jgi:hypothetical protein